MKRFVSRLWLPLVATVAITWAYFMQAIPFTTPRATKLVTDAICAERDNADYEYIINKQGCQHVRPEISTIRTGRDGLLCVAARIETLNGELESIHLIGRPDFIANTAFIDIIETDPNGLVPAEATELLESEKLELSSLKSRVPGKLIPDKTQRLIEEQRSFTERIAELEIEIAQYSAFRAKKELSWKYVCEGMSLDEAKQRSAALPFIKPSSRYEPKSTKVLMQIVQ